MKTVLMLLALCGVAMGANVKEPKTIVIDGQTIIPQDVTYAFEPAIVSNVKFANATNVETGGPCTAIKGTVISNVACGEATLIITINLWLARNGTKALSSDLQACIAPRGKATVRIGRFEPGRSIAFTAIGPPWYPVGAKDEHIRHGWKPSYSVTYAFEQIAAKDF